MTQPADPTEALAAGRWAEAAAGFRAVLADGPDPAAQDGLAHAAWWLDDGATCLAAREAAYRGHRALGDRRAAARSALSLGYDAVLFGQGRAVGAGWLGRAAELLDGLGEVPELGWLEARRAEAALVLDHDAATARDTAERARQLAPTDEDLAAVATALRGLAGVRLGDVRAGMHDLDVAVAAATAGDVSDLMWTGKICCWVILACQETRDLTRAGEWCRRVEALCAEQDLAPLFTVCRTQYAAILIERGDASAAETALGEVIDRTATSRRVSRLEAVVRLGELRRRQGRLTEAVELLSQAEFDRAAVVALASVRLARGDTARAWSDLEALLGRTADPLDRVDALRAGVVALDGLGRRDQARHLAAELRAVADRVGTGPLGACAAAAEATLGGPEEAVRSWTEAIRGFSDAGLRFDEADARLGLARTLRDRGDAEGAAEAATRAAALLDELGVRRPPALDSELRTLTGSRKGPLTPRQSEVLDLVAQGLTNAEIAARLQLSEHTVHRHVANILATLGLTTRAAAAAYAAGHELI